MTSARTLHPQDQIAHYRIVGPLGAGGMGEVYLAQDQTLERNVALKILPPELVQSEERVRRFVREAKSASSLNHPNIVTIYEIGQDEVRGAEGVEKDSGSSSLHYISMELVSGDTLATKIHLDKTDLRTLLGYLAQAAEGLAKAHAAGIVHRDLKPGNIMVSKDGFAKVLDFGLAKLTEKAPADADVTSGPTHGDGTSVGAVVGTVGYMSPEQVRGAAVDHRSDIFSFGCILYEAATRKKPFTAESNVETMHRILHDKPTPVEEINKEIPTEVRRLIRRCLAKNPDQRFQSAKDLAIELREVVDEYDSLTASGSSGSGSTALGAPPARRRGLSPIAIIAGAVVLAGVLVTAGLLIRRGQEGAAPAAPAAIRVSTVTNQGIARASALSSDGRYYAYIVSIEGLNTIRVRQLATGSDVEVLPPQKNRLEQLIFTPDGSYLYYNGADPDRQGYRALFAVPALGGTPRKRLYDIDSRASFSPDGKQVAFRRGAPHAKQELLVLYDLEKNQERTLATVSNPITLTQPAWSPDGKKVAVIEDNGTGSLASTLATYRVADGKRETIGARSWLGAVDVVWLPDGSGLIISALDTSTATEAQLWQVDARTGRERRITNDASQYVSLSPSGDGTMLAATRIRTEANLWSAASTGARRLRQLSFGSADEGAVANFTVGADTMLFFNMVKDGSSQIWSLGRSGGTPTKISGAHRYAAIHRDAAAGGVIAIQVDADREPHIWRLDPNGENARQLTTGKGEFPINVSPDGKTLLFERNEEVDVLWSVPTEGGAPVRLGTSSRGSALFSPDGRRILHTVIRSENGQGVFTQEVINADGSGTPIRIPLPSRADDRNWSPDGKAITFVDGADLFMNIHRIPVEGGAITPITRFTDGRIVSHWWSPDGKQILIHRRGAGNASNLWVCAADGSKATPITDFETGDITDAHWSPDGTLVYFTYGESSQNAVLIRNFK
ncbi:MAG TPA: protein kinase [Candidatus Eisenbacteria bacterium]|nr:protein kinase [Candidatus Eisenbacteria bacterium]